MVEKLTRYFREDGYGARAVRGTLLSAVQFGSGNVLRLVSNLILTRLLFPEAFGLMALVQLVLNGASMFSTIGIRGSIVQDERGAEPIFLDTAWTISILRGILLCIVVQLIAGPVARFYEQPMLESLLRLSGFVPLIGGFSSTRFTVLEREIRQGRITVIMLGMQMLNLGVTILFALWLDSVWALAWGGVTGSLLPVIATHVLLPGHKNRLRIERDAAMRMFRYGRWIAVAAMAAYFINQGDRAILGKFVTLETLALYNIAWMMASIPVTFGRSLVQKVVFPLYARRSPGASADNAQKLGKARRLGTLVLVLVSFLLAAIGIPLIEFLYDARYHGAGPFLVLIALANIPAIITVSYDRLPLAAGHSGRFAAYKIFFSVLNLALLFWGVTTYGVGGVILAQAVIVLVTYPALALMTRPYNQWDPLHDLGYFALWSAGSLAILLWQWPAIEAVFAAP